MASISRVSILPPRRIRDEPVHKIGAPFEQALPAACVAALSWRRNAGGHQFAHDASRGLCFVGPGLDEKIDQSASAGEQHIARRQPLAPVGGCLPSHLRNDPPETRFEIDEWLQVFFGEPLLGELSHDGVQALGAERELALAIAGIVAMRLAKRLERRADAVDGW
jgi:hypothetical protein